MVGRWNRRQGNKDQRTNRAPAQTPAPVQPKYVHPKILLIDVQPDAAKLLAAEGYNVSTGTFGSKYRVEMGHGYVPVIPHARFPPDYAEQEIIVVDLAPRAILDGPPGAPATALEEEGWWASADTGVIDPRPIAMIASRGDLGRILDYGGVFVIFAAPRELPTIARGYRNHYGAFTQQTSFALETWSFLPHLGGLHFEVREVHGREITPVSGSDALRQLVSSHLRSASFTCTLHPDERQLQLWQALGQNKYGAPIAGTMIVPGEHGAGLIIILPQLDDKPGFLTRLVSEVLPDLVPRLFPQVEGGLWVQQPEYELHGVQAIQQEIQHVEEQVRRRMAELQQQIEEERAASGYLHDMLTETGEALVAAVKKTLETLGFQHVVDVDAQRKAQGDRGPKREDLQVDDVAGLLLIEVKGLDGIPPEGDCLQVAKYVKPRMRELKRTDVQGLAIINCERGVPALHRRGTPFTRDVLTNAVGLELGLLTTWDLFRLTRSFLSNGWTHDQIKDLFYRHGRIDPIPAHYHFVGTVEKFFERAGAAGVDLTHGDLRLGDRIAFELPVEFLEQEITSLQVEDASVEYAPSGAKVGILTGLTRAQARNHARVFRIASAPVVEAPCSEAQPDA